MTLLTEAEKGLWKSIEEILHEKDLAVKRAEAAERAIAHLCADCKHSKRRECTRCQPTGDYFEWVGFEEDA